MTVSSETLARVQYNGNGSTTVFSVPFVFSTSADLEVYITVVATGVETLKTLTTHYTVSGGGGTSAPATGSITFLTAPASGERVTILRSLANTQSVDYVENDAFPAQSHELALDRITLQVQDLKENLSRAIVFTPGSTSTDISVASPVAGSVLVWDDTATIIETVSLDTVAAPVALSAAGLMACTSLTPRTYAGRTLTGTANQVTITNGDGVSGNPTISLPSSIVAPGSIDATTNITIKGANELRLNNSGDTYYTGFKAPALSANKIYTLPTGDGTSGQLLSTNGSGVLSWSTVSAGGDMVKISTTTVSGSPSTIDFTSLDTSTYKAFVIDFSPLFVTWTLSGTTQTPKIGMQLYLDGVLQSSANKYSGNTHRAQATSASMLNAVTYADTEISLAQAWAALGTSGTGYMAITGRLYLNTLSRLGVGINTHGVVTGSLHQQSITSASALIGGVANVGWSLASVGTAVNGFRLMLPVAGTYSGVFTNGSIITLYGIK